MPRDNLAYNALQPIQPYEAFALKPLALRQVADAPRLIISIVTINKISAILVYVTGSSWLKIIFKTRSLHPLLLDMIIFDVTMARAQLTLAELSPEIGLLILLQISSIKDLHSFIQASSRHYNIFRLNKLRILTSVVRHAFHPELLPLALSICDAACTSRLSEKVNSRCSLYHALINRNPKDADILERRASSMKLLMDFQKPNQAKDIPKDKLTIYSLCRLQRLLDCFIGDFASDTLTILQETKSNNSTQPSLQPRLSSSEYSRLQRAFLHFELYRRIFGGLENVAYRVTGLAEVRAEHLFFLTVLKMYELGELLTVNEYLIRRMEIVFDNTESLVISLLRKAALRDGEEILGSRMTVEDLEWFGLGIYDQNNKHTQQEVIAYFVELGLPFCRRFFSMDVESQMNMVVSFWFARCSPSLSSVSRHYGETPLEPEELRSLAEHNLSNDTPSNWLESGTPARKPAISGWQEKDYNLRQTGYYIWDESRAPPEYWDNINLTLLRKRDRGSERPVPKILEGMILRDHARDDIEPTLPEAKEMVQMIERLEY